MRRLILRRLATVAAIWLGAGQGNAQDQPAWQEIIAQMPLPQAARELNRTNCVDLCLRAFTSNATVKALVFMPGATDEFYMFRRAKAQLTNAQPSLLDAINALTGQTQIRVTFYPPLLLLHTDEDPLEPLIQVEHEATAEKLKHGYYVAHCMFNDRDWTTVQPVLRKRIFSDILPFRHSYDTWHFYRHSFAGWGLSGWEMIEAVGMAGKTSVAVRRRQLIFEGDDRIRATPKVEQFPK
jgi:hypothetical protein